MFLTDCRLKYKSKSYLFSCCFRVCLREPNPRTGFDLGTQLGNTDRNTVLHEMWMHPGKSNSGGCDRGAKTIDFITNECAFSPQSCTNYVRGLVFCAANIIPVVSSPIFLLPARPSVRPLVRSSVLYSRRYNQFAALVTANSTGAFFLFDGKLLK